MRRAALLALGLLAACGGVRERGQGELGQTGGGVRLSRGAQTIVGSAAFCTQPATISKAQVQAATPEGQEIRRENVQPGSARYKLLESRMHQRILRVCQRVAREAGCDLVVRSGDIADARGLQVQDLTADVVQAMRDEG